MVRDKLFSGPRPDLVDFIFDDSVAEVFPDMIRRSVPGYETIVSLIGCIAGKYALPGSNVYDLGCSLGASTISMASRIEVGRVSHICIDNSPDMIARCQENLETRVGGSAFQCIKADICDVEIANASVVVMNFSLQFIAPELRDGVLRKICDGMLSGGILILSEKVNDSDQDPGGLIAVLHEQFKKANGYSDLEISQKRSALENVMILDSGQEHLERLQRCGFSVYRQWFQALGFHSYVALK
jgi:tRNA (cmo5U34)-methyltransferase